MKKICYLKRGEKHTGLSDKDEIGIVHRPWTAFFASWTSNRRASP